MIGWKPVINDPNVASARIRCFSPLESLRRQGWSVELFHENRETSYSAVVFQKAYDDESLATARRLKSRGANVVFDLCDNVFHTWSVAQPNAVHLANLEEMTSLADVVTVSTEELARHVRGSRLAPRVIRDGLELPAPWVRWRRSLRNSEPVQLRLGWFGIAKGSDGYAGVADLARLVPLLNRIAKLRPTCLEVFSNSLEDVSCVCKNLTLPWFYHPWRGPRFFNWQYSSVDITLIPVTPTPFSVCKSNNRLALSLLLGIPVVADSIPSYREFEEVCLLDQWEDGLSRFVADADLRQEQARRGRAIVESRYLVAHAAAEWASLFGSFGERIRI